MCRRHQLGRVRLTPPKYGLHLRKLLLPSQSRRNKETPFWGWTSSVAHLQHPPLDRQVLHQPLEARWRPRGQTSSSLFSRCILPLLVRSHNLSRKAKTSLVACNLQYHNSHQHLVVLTTLSVALALLQRHLLHRHSRSQSPIPLPASANHLLSDQASTPHQSNHLRHLVVEASSTQAQNLRRSR